MPLVRLASKCREQRTLAVATDTAIAHSSTVLKRGMSHYHRITHHA